MIQPLRENNFIWLTLSLIATLLAGALTDEFPDVIALSLLEYANLAFLLVALLSLRRDGSWIKGLAILIVIMLTLIVAKNATGQTKLIGLYLVFLLGFYAIAGWLVGRQVLLTGSVDLNKLVGSIALYFLMGMIFAVLYTILLYFSPDAIRGLESSSSMEHMSSTTYFSFVTLTTLGYGEIVPVSPLARVLVIIEAVTGMFYLAIVVASLIGAMKNKD